MDVFNSIFLTTYKQQRLLILVRNYLDPLHYLYFCRQVLPEQFSQILGMVPLLNEIFNNSLKGFYIDCATLSQTVSETADLHVYVICRSSTSFSVI